MHSPPHAKLRVLQQPNRGQSGTSRNVACQMEALAVPQLLTAYCTGSVAAMCPYDRLPLDNLTTGGPRKRHIAALVPAALLTQPAP